MIRTEKCAKLPSLRILGMAMPQAEAAKTVNETTKVIRVPAPLVPVIAKQLAEYRLEHGYERKRHHNFRVPAPLVADVLRQVKEHQDEKRSRQYEAEIARYERLAESKGQRLTASGDRSP